MTTPPAPSAASSIDAPAWPLAAAGASPGALLADAGHASPQASASRVEAVDFVRGAAMVLMALDHVRHFFSDALSAKSTELMQRHAPQFLTRWVTHFCAPAFIYLAGVAAFLSMAAKGRTAAELRSFLLKRGLMLVVLELTVVRCLGWTFNVDYHYALAGVIWVLGWCMIVLAPLVHVPKKGLLVAGLLLIVGHDAFDRVRPGDVKPFGWLWKLLHSPGTIEPIHGVHFKVAYPLVPWIGLMMVGFATGSVFLRAASDRRRTLVSIGLLLTVSFVVLRLLNGYGDPKPWSSQETGLATALSFVKCDKYPPSLLFLLMTMGPVLCALGLHEKLPSFLGRPFLVFGRVPLLYYLIHLPIIHALAVVFSLVRYGDASWLFMNPPSAHGPSFPLPPDYGYSLPVLYGLWIGVVVLLFPVCRWYERKKRVLVSPWLRYI